jgi:hypothetical protein
MLKNTRTLRFFIPLVKKSKVLLREIKRILMLLHLSRETQWVIDENC